MPTFCFFKQIVLLKAEEDSAKFSGQRTRQNEKEEGGKERQRNK